MIESIKVNNRYDGVHLVLNGRQSPSRLASLIQRLAIFLMVVLFAFSSADKAFHYSGFLNALRDYSLVHQ